MSNFDKEQNNSQKKIVLPPPPKASKSNNNNINGGGDSDNKLKLKRLQPQQQQQQQHTISGGGGCSTTTTTTKTIGGGNNIITTTTATNVVDDDDVVGGVGGGNVCGKNIQQQQQEIYSIIINPIESCSSNIDSIMTAAATAAASTTTSTTIDNLQQQQQSSIMINNTNNNNVVDNRSTITTTTTATATPPPPPTTTTTMKQLNQDSIFKMDDDDGGGAAGFEIVAPKVALQDYDKMMIRKDPPPGVKDGGVYFNNNDDDDQDDDLWTMTGEQQQYYIKQFQMLQKNSNGNIQGQVAKVFFEKSGLEAKELSHIWKMSDLDEDGQLSLPEFCIAMHLVVLRRNQVMMPDKLPTPLKNYYVNFSCTLNGGGGGGSSYLLDQSSLDRNNSVEMLDLDLELDIGTEQNNNVTDHHQHNRHNHHRSQSQSQRNSQPNWTRFNDDSPNALLLIKNENEHQPSSSENGSPIKLANFDYDINYIASNPNIKHPIPLRKSPTSPTLSSMEQINIDDVINAAEKCSIQSSPSSIDSFDFVNKPQPFFPVSQTTSDEILKQSLLINTQEPNDCDLFKKIFDHVKNIEHRFCRMNPIKGNLLTTSIQQENKSDSDKIEELKQIIQTTDSNRRLLLQQNYQLYQDVGGLLKIVNYLFENKIPPKNFAAAVSEKSQNNDDFAGKLAKI